MIRISDVSILYWYSYITLYILLYCLTVAIMCNLFDRRPPLFTKPLSGASRFLGFDSSAVVLSYIYGWAYANPGALISSTTLVVTRQLQIFEIVS